MAWSNPASRIRRSSSAVWWCTVLSDSIVCSAFATVLRAQLADSSLALVATVPQCLGRDRCNLMDDPDDCNGFVPGQRVDGRQLPLSTAMGRGERVAYTLPPPMCCHRQWRLR